MKSYDWLDGVPDTLALQIRFLMEADRLKLVSRGNRVADGSRHENTAEHSWHLALFAMILSDYADEQVNFSRVIQMLLVHDLVEIDSGDTPLFDEQGTATQADRENLAAERLFGMLPNPQGGTLKQLWVEFEAAETVDARFAKALDRFQPILLNHAVGGGTWQDYKIDEDRERKLTQRIAEGSKKLWNAAEKVFADAVQKGWLRPSLGPQPPSKLGDGECPTSSIPLSP
jgi:putative hydrolase of HD superfamily